MSQIKDRLYKYTNSLLFLSPLFIGFIVRYIRTVSVSINPDDINFYEIALNSSFLELIQVKYWAIDYPQLFFLFFKAVGFITSDLLILKLFNLAFYIGSSILIYKVSWYLFQTKKTLFIVLAYAFSPFFIIADTTFNPYSGSLFFSLLLIERYLKVRAHYSRHNILWIVFTTIVGSFFSYAFYFAVAAVLTYAAIEFLTNRKPSARKELLVIGGLMIGGTLPSLMQLVTHLSGFSPMSPYPTTLHMVFSRYLEDIWPIYNQSINFVFLGVLVFIFVRDVAQKQVKISLFVVSILIVSFVSYYVMDLLDLFLTTRLFFLFHFGLILLLFSLLHRSRMGIVTLIFIIAIMSTPTLRSLLFHRTNKTTYETIAQLMYKSCTGDSFYIIDSSSFHYYPLYHYYIPNSNVRTQEQYECILGQTRTFDVDIKRESEIDQIASNYYFINLNNKTKRGGYWSRLCTENKDCFVYVSKLKSFVKTSSNHIGGLFNISNIISEFE